MSEFFAATMCVFGITAMLVGSRYGPPAVFREWCKSLSQSKSWSAMWDCGMCVSFWVGLFSIPFFVSVMEAGPEMICLPFPSAGVFYVIEKMKPLGVNRGR